MALEKPSQSFPTLRRIADDFGVHHAASAVVAFLFATTGPVAIVLSVGARGGLTESDIASWIFSAFVFNTFISAAFSVLYRQPLVFLWSIPGAVLLGPALGHLGFPEVIGAFVASFAGRFGLGALVCFLVTVADVPIFNIGAPFGGLVLGPAASSLLERE